MVLPSLVLNAEVEDGQECEVKERVVNPATSCRSAEEHAVCQTETIDQGCVGSEEEGSKCNTRLCVPKTIDIKTCQYGLSITRLNCTAISV